MRLRTLFIALLSSCIITISAQDTLLLFHPTVYNLELIKSLFEQGMLDLEGYHILGVYHSGEAYNYDSAITKVSENPDGIFSLIEITGELEAGNLFGNNPCTPLFRELFTKSRGALFFGGPDIPPLMYQERVHLLTSVSDPFRHFLEASFIFHLLGGSQDSLWVPWLKSNDLFLMSGICLGVQSMNVATGGTLIQDIPTEVYGVWSAEDVLEMPRNQVHRNYKDMVETTCGEFTSYHFHQVRLKEGSFLQVGLEFKKQSTPLVLSSHHQAIESLGRGWKISATSMDGKIIEAIEHDRYPHVFGVQFHPEKPGLFDPDIILNESCNEQINFHQVIEGSESLRFHVAYWKYIGGILQEVREK